MPQHLHEHELGTTAPDVVRCERVADSVERSGRRDKLQAPAEKLKVPQNNPPIELRTFQRGKDNLMAVTAEPAKQHLSQFVGERYHPLFITLADHREQEVVKVDVRGDSEACRSAFRSDVDHDSEMKPISIPI